MARLDTVVVTDLDLDYYPAPSPESLAAAHEAGLTSVVAAPLYARGELLGVMSLALSRLTDREERNYDAPDRDLIGAIASRVAIAIDNSMLFETSGRPPWPSRRACSRRRPGLTDWISPAGTRQPSRWKRRARGSRRRSAATGTTSSRWLRAGSASSSATWRAAARAPRRSWARCAPR